MPGCRLVISLLTDFQLPKEVCIRVKHCYTMANRKQHSKQQLGAGSILYNSRILELCTQYLTLSNFSTTLHYWAIKFSYIAWLKSLKKKYSGNKRCLYADNVNPSSFPKIEMLAHKDCVSVKFWWKVPFILATKFDFCNMQLYKGIWFKSDYA